MAVARNAFGGTYLDNSPSGGVSPTSSFGDPSTFTAAANTQASDYDKIMQSYGNIAKTAASNPITPAPVSPSTIAPVTSQYNQSPDVTNSLSTLSGLSATGGYTPAGIADIRARDIAPTRSIYANAQQNVERAKALGGGYSPNYNATQASMARDESNQIGDVTTAANAGIAQNVASNQIAAASPYAAASASANAAKAQSDQHNTDIVNHINELNQQNKLSAGEFNSQGLLGAQQANRQTQLGATQGQASLYGTTPALTSTFGNQVATATNLGQNQQQINNQRQKNLFGVASQFG